MLANAFEDSGDSQVADAGSVSASDELLAPALLGLQVPLCVLIAL